MPERSRKSVVAKIRQSGTLSSNVAKMRPSSTSKRSGGSSKKDETKNLIGKPSLKEDRRTSAEIDADHHKNLPICPKELHKIQEAEERKKWGPVKRLVNGPFFEPLCTVGILGFAALVGAEVEYMARNPNENYNFFIVMNNAFNIWFAVELVCRMLAEWHVYWFFFNKDWRWNWFDFILVVSFLFEFITELAYNLNPYAKLWVKSIKIFRIVRIIRIFRIVRMLKFIGEVRRMVMSIICSCKMLFWSMMILFLELYVFAVVFVRATVDYTQLDDTVSDEAAQALNKNFGTLERSLYSLFKAISGGQSWFELSDPLLDIHWFYFTIFLTFIAITDFAMLNILTSVFVDAAMESAQLDQEFMAQQAAEKKERYEKSVSSLFDEMDEDGSGTVCWEEFEKALWDPRMQAYLEALEIEPSHGADLFKLLDHDGSGVVDTKEFIEGCNRVKGTAKAFDIQTVLYDAGKIKAQVRSMNSEMERSFSDLSQKLGEGGGPVGNEKNDDSRDAVQKRLKRLFLVATTPQLLKIESDLQDAIEKAYNDKKAWKQDQLASADKKKKDRAVEDATPRKKDRNAEEVSVSATPRRRDKDQAKQAGGSKSLDSKSFGIEYSKDSSSAKRRPSPDDRRDTDRSTKERKEKKGDRDDDGKKRSKSAM